MLGFLVAHWRDVMKLIGEMWRSSLEGCGVAHCWGLWPSSLVRAWQNSLRGVPQLIVGFVEYSSSLEGCEVAHCWGL
jgi:hypothetical protein